jgi:hypothetical protein
MAGDDIVERGRVGSVAGSLEIRNVGGLIVSLDVER